LLQSFRRQVAAIEQRQRKVFVQRGDMVRISGTRVRSHALRVRAVLGIRVQLLPLLLNSFPVHVLLLRTDSACSLQRAVNRLDHFRIQDDA